MIRIFSLIALLGLLVLGCSPDPGTKKVPFEEKKKVEKKLNDITFNPTLDILFIVDDSGSMYTFQQELASNATAFIDAFFKTKFIDYHIGVTTSTRSGFGQTGASGGILRNVNGYNYVDRKTANGEIVLSEMMNVGTSGSATEEFFSIHMLSLSPSLTSGVNKGFYREDAQLAIFVLTDTEDQSSFSTRAAYDFLLNLKNGNEEKLFYAAALAKQVASCRGEFERPIKIREMVTLHKDRGFVFDLCKPDYGADLAMIAEDLVESVSTIYLDEVPDVTTLKVVYGDIEIPNSVDKGWVYDADRNAIYLSPNIDIWTPDPQPLNIKFESIYK